MILIVFLASNFWSSLAQNVNQPQEDPMDYMLGTSGRNGLDDVSAIAARYAYGNAEPSCEELRAMWR